MATSTKSPGTMADDATVGTATWSNPNNAKVSDGIYSEVNDIGGFNVSHYLKATNFGFSIPSGATINGILVEIERKESNARDNLYDNEVKIVKADGSIGTTNKKLVAEWSTTEGYYSYGSSSDLWNESWDSSKINDVDFGVVLSINIGTDGYAYVDHIRITVYYTEAVTDNGSPFFGFL